MKKVTLSFIALLCSVSIFSTHYLVELGTMGAASWSGTTLTATIVDLDVEGKTLDEWFNAAAPVRGDEVWIAAGTYVVNAPLQLLRSRTAGKNTNICNFYGGFVGTETTIDERAKGTNTWDFINPTILDGNDACQLLIEGNDFNGYYMAKDDDEYSIFNGFTLTRGTFAGDGGAMEVGGAIKIQDCKFTSNNATDTGQGGALYSGRYTEVDGCYFYDNHTEQGAGGAAYLGTQESSVSNSLFEFNSANDSKTSNPSGGALYLGATSTTLGKLENCIFRGNSMTQGFGAVSVGGSTTSPTEIINCLIVNNSGTHQYGGNEAALYLNGGVKIINTTVANNVGGVYYNGATATGRDMINTLVYGNSDLIFRSGAGIANVTNCAVDLSQTAIETAASATVTNLIDLTSVAATNVFASPTTFVGLPTSDGEKTELSAANWQLAAASPCIDAGTSTGAPATDIEGTTRPEGTGIDIGAYEYGTNSSIGNIEKGLSYFITISGNTVLISGLQAATGIAVYNVAGVLVKQVAAEGSVAFELEKGIYLICVGDNVSKLVLK